MGKETTIAGIIPPQTAAAGMLANGAGVVILNNSLALRRTASCLHCEVIESPRSSRLCEHEFEVLVENAQNMLYSSRLGTRLPDIPRKWLVVEDSGTDLAELWRAR